MNKHINHKVNYDQIRDTLKAKTLAADPIPEQPANDPISNTPAPARFYELDDFDGMATEDMIRFVAIECIDLARLKPDNPSAVHLLQVAATALTNLHKETRLFDMEYNNLREHNAYLKGLGKKTSESTTETLL